MKIYENTIGELLSDSKYRDMFKFRIKIDKVLDPELKEILSYIQDIEVFSYEGLFLVKGKSICVRAMEIHNRFDKRKIAEKEESYGVQSTESDENIIENT